MSNVPELHQGPGLVCDLLSMRQACWIAEETVAFKLCSFASSVLRQGLLSRQRFIAPPFSSLQHSGSHRLHLLLRCGAGEGHVDLHVKFTQGHEGFPGTLPLVPVA